MFHNLFHYALIATTLVTLKVAGVDGALTKRYIPLNQKISNTAQQIFKESGKSGLSEEEKLEITHKGMKDFQATIADWDYDRPHVGSGVTLQKAALKRKKGYISFEDGENDDHFHNIMACIYDNRIPEMIVIHGGNGKLRLATYEWFWKAAQKLTGCDIPELLLGGKGSEEPSVFDSVEGMGGLEETERQRYINNPMDSATRKKIAQNTYTKVADHISKLDRVNIGLKTAPTDLVEVIALVNKRNPRKAKEKMFIVWSCPGSFKSSPNEDKFQLLTRFNFYRNPVASDKLLESGINMVLTGNDLYFTRVRGFVDAEFAPKMARIDPKWNGIKGFEGLKDLSEKAPQGTIFGLYRTVQETFQARKVMFGERYLEYVINPVRRWLRKLQQNPAAVGKEKIERPNGEFQDSDLMSRADIEDKLTQFEKDFGQRLQAPKDSFKKEIEQMEREMNDLEYREQHLVKRWKPFANDRHYLEGCTADPHLEFILNPNMRKSSVKEVIPVKVKRNYPNTRPGLLNIEVQENSNCWVTTDLDSTDFFNMYQALIKLFAEHKEGRLNIPPFHYQH